jgi:hypothetical protein
MEVGVQVYVIVGVPTLLHDHYGPWGCASWHHNFQLHRHSLPHRLSSAHLCGLYDDHPDFTAAMRLLLRLFTSKNSR